ncbi:MAG: stage V sporulation protein E [Halanaerobiaceae bacterium]
MGEEKTVDYLIIFSVVTLLMIGLVMILSASSVRSSNLYGDSYYLFKRQLIFTIIGIIFMFIFMNIDYHRYIRYSRIILLVALILLILVLIPGVGKSAGGSRRWLSLGLVRLQPSEVAKLGLVFYVSHFISRKKDSLKSFTTGVLPLLIVLGVVFILILLEPDLGTGITIVGTFFIMLFAGGIRLNHLFLLIMGALPLFSYFILTEEYRRRRLLAFLDPWKDPLDTGYHIIQSLLALGSGGLFGVGIGNSHQKFLYLPEPGTDFIFAVLGEEMGIIGTSVVVLLYFLLAWRGFKTSLSAPDIFGSLLAIGITSMIILQAFINIGVVTASLPVTGITLPFISYGGTSLVIMLSGIGILLNISRNTVN